MGGGGGGGMGVGWAAFPVKGVAWGCWGCGGLWEIRKGLVLFLADLDFILRGMTLLLLLLEPELCGSCLPGPELAEPLCIVRCVINGRVKSSLLFKTFTLPSCCNCSNLVCLQPSLQCLESNSL